MEDVRSEWIDRYGPVPPPAEALLEVGRLRAECSRVGIREIVVARAPNAVGHAAQARISPVQLKTSASIRLKRLVRDAVYKEDAGQIVVPVKGKGVDVARALVTLLSELIPVEESAPLASSAP